MIELMVVMLMIYFTCDELVPIIRNGSGIWGQNCNKIFHLNFVAL